MWVVARRVSALGPWLAEAKHTWLALSISVLVLFTCLQPHTSEPFIRLSGLVLQVFGIGTVVWGILATRRFFGHPFPTALIWNWIKRCPLRKRSITTTIEPLVSRSFVGNAHVYKRAPIDPTATVDIRLTALERNIALIHDRITEKTSEIDKDLGALRNLIEDEVGKRETVEEKLHGHIEDVSTGGIHITAIG